MQQVLKQGLHFTAGTGMGVYFAMKMDDMMFT